MLERKGCLYHLFVGNTKFKKILIKRKMIFENHIEQENKSKFSLRNLNRVNTRRPKNKSLSRLLAMNCPRSCTWYRIWISANQLFSFLKKTYVLYNSNKNNAARAWSKLRIYSWIWTRVLIPKRHPTVLTIFTLIFFILMSLSSFIERL